MSPRRLGKVLKQLREQKSMSQRDLAAKADIKQPYIVQLETGKKKNPSLDVLKRLAKALGVRVGELLE